MKRILITGKNSYIGTSFENYLSKFPNEYYVETLDMRDENWRSFDFSKFDVVFHVAGIAHIKETKKNRDLYFKINRNLAIETAKHAQVSGVKQFIFLSTMSVFGLDEGIIVENTPTLPKNAYGQSKLEAEKEIFKLNNEEFKVAIVRPPMVYGKGCKGNYQRLSKLAKITPIFPDINNKRSMIFIDNLSLFTKRLIDISKYGLYHPQNIEYVRTSEMFQIIAKIHGKRVVMTKIFNFLIILFSVNTLKKVFGNLVYDECMSVYEFSYIECKFKESILITEGKSK